jgi:hypothetical protein
MDDKEKTSLLNMPGDELSATMKRLSRYTLAVEMIPIGACLPLFTRNEPFLLGGIAFTMLVGLLFMHFCNERKQKKWNVIKSIQCILALMDFAAVIFYKALEGIKVTTLLIYISLFFLWIHVALCVIDYRKEEQILFLRFLGAITVVLTMLVCYVISTWMNFQVDSFLF